MINTAMRDYDFYTFGEKDSYGQQHLSEDVQGTVKMAINLTSQTASDNIKYKDCTYVGLTHDKRVNDSFVIQYGNEKLKVMYINTFGRFIQAYMAEM